VFGSTIFVIHFKAFISWKSTGVWNDPSENLEPELLVGEDVEVDLVIESLLCGTPEKEKAVQVKEMAIYVFEF